VSGGFVSRWPVRQVHDVAASDLDTGGAVGEEALERWVEAAWSERVALCPALRRSGLRLCRRALDRPPAAGLGRPARVVVTAGVTEVRPASFTLAVRLRPVRGEAGRVVDTRWLAWLEDPATGTAADLGDGVRDELIGAEQSARFTG
jgi:hypothetical protein